MICKLGCAVLVALAFSADLAGQGLYKYRDAQGNRVFSDRRPDSTRDFQQLPLAPPESPPEVSITHRLVDGRAEFVADNACYCPVEIAMRLLEPANTTQFEGGAMHVVAPARRATVLASLRPVDAKLPMSFGFEYRASLGDPEAQHSTGELYRAPFALARAFRVTQAYPGRITHNDAASAYAIDVAMPIGTQVYAARAGTVIEVASRFFEAGTDPRQATRANIIRVLHADGTMSVYAHLNWDSIRVRPGQVVKRGEYIADSGNTGFSTGPHLHFVVQRNAGLHLESLPVDFAGRASSPARPKMGETWMAY